MHPGQVLARETAPHEPVGAQAKEQGVELVEQHLRVHLAADLDPQAELDPQGGEQLPPPGEHGFLQLELGDAEG